MEDTKTVNVDELKKELRKEIEIDLIKQYDAEYARQLQEHVKKMDAENQELIQKAIEKWRQEQEPLSNADISTLLNQEYQTFDIKLPFGGAEKTFVITELPIKTEKRFYGLIKEKLVPKLRDINLMSDPDQTLEQQAITLFNIIDPAMEILAEAVVICLDPRKETPELTPEWVQENLSAFRAWNIVQTQIEVNKVRDFLSSVSPNSQNGRTKNLVGFRK